MYVSFPSDGCELNASFSIIDSKTGEGYTTQWARMRSALLTCQGRTGQGYGRGADVARREPHDVSLGRLVELVACNGDDPSAGEGNPFRKARERGRLVDADAAQRLHLGGESN